MPVLLSKYWNMAAPVLSSCLPLPFLPPLDPVELPPGEEPDVAGDVEAAVELLPEE